MFEFHFYLFILFLGLPLLLGVIIYLMINTYLTKKMAKYFGLAFTVVYLSLAGFLYFEDHFFTKNDALKVLQEKNITLNEPFELLDHRKESSFNDSFHTFELKISEKDKHRLIQMIKNSENYKSIEESRNNDSIENYETKNEFIRKHQVPNDASYQSITINKNENKLVYENFNQ